LYASKKDTNILIVNIIYKQKVFFITNVYINALQMNGKVI
jgi:hypothetical protein